MMATGLWCMMTASAQTADSTAWRNVFTDPQLRNLIETALEHNADLRTANLNVEQADAGLRMARLAMLPSLTVGAEGSLSKTKGTSTTKTYNVTDITVGGGFVWTLAWREAGGIGQLLEYGRD